MRRALPPLIGLALALGACDDGDPPERAATNETAPRTQTDRAAPGQRRPTAAAYRRALNRLCRADERAAKSFGEPATPGQLTSYLRRTLAYSRRREPLYRALEPPPELRSAHRRSLELGDEVEARFARVLRQIDAGGDPIEEFTEALPRLAAAVEENNRFARRVGAKDCVAVMPAPGAQSPQEPS